MKIKVDFRKVVLVSVTSFAFWVAFERVHDFYVENVPIGREGSCFSIKYPGVKDRYEMRIIKNSNEENKSTVILSLIPSSKSSWQDTFTYFQLRMLDPKSMECL